MRPRRRKGSVTGDGLVEIEEGARGREAVERVEHGEFGGFRRTRGAASEGGGEAFLLDHLGQGLGGLEEGWVVEERQCLERGIAAVTTRARGKSVRGVEDREGRRRGHAVGEGVESAARTVWALARIPDALHLAEGHHAIRDGRIDGRSADLVGEQSAGDERGVAHEFRVESKPRLPAEQAVVWVLLVEVGPLRGIATIGAREHNRAVQRLQAPTTLDEFHGQPVKHLGVGG